MVYPGTMFTEAMHRCADQVVLAVYNGNVIWSYTDDPHTCRTWSRELFDARVRERRIRIMRGLAPPRSYLKKVLRSYRNMLKTPDDTPRSLYNVGDMRVVKNQVNGINDMLIFAGVNGTRNGHHGLWFSTMRKDITYAPIESMMYPVVPYAPETRDEVKGIVRAVVDGVSSALRHQWWLRM